MRSYYCVMRRSRTPVQNAEDDPLILSLVKWSPKGNAFAYVYYNNVYYRPNATAQEDVQLTTSDNASIYHGICDWVYEGMRAFILTTCAICVRGRTTASFDLRGDAKYLLLIFAAASITYIRAAMI